MDSVTGFLVTFTFFCAPRGIRTPNNGSEDRRDIHFTMGAVLNKLLKNCLGSNFRVRVGRIELPSHPWQGCVLPLNHTCKIN